MVCLLSTILQNHVTTRIHRCVDYNACVKMVHIVHLPSCTALPSVDLSCLERHPSLQHLALEVCCPDQLQMAYLVAAGALRHLEIRAADTRWAGRARRLLCSLVFKEGGI